MNTSHHRQAALSTCRARRSLLSVAVAAGLLTQGALYAQDSATTSPAKSPEDITQLDTVTVTAQGREQNILDVPYNISAVEGDTIERANIQDTAELMRYVPGVGVIDRGARGSSTTSSIRIRGLNVDSSALGDFAVGAAATVATYVDKTPLYANFLLSDIDRVEVLRGPQGTLYGSGALGGAVRYIMRQPDFAYRSGRVSASLSSVEHSNSIGKSGSFTFNQPFSDTFAIRVNGTVNDFPGVTDYPNLYVLDQNGIPVAPSGRLSTDAAYRKGEDVDTVEQHYGRVALRWQPSEAVDLTFSYMAQADRFGGRRATSLGVDGYGRPYQDLEVGSIQEEPAARHVNLTSLEASFDLGFATLTSSTASSSHEGNLTSENTGFYAQNRWLANFYYNYPRPMASAVRGYADKSITQEVRLVSETGGTFDYTLGAFYQKQKRRIAQDSFLRGIHAWGQAAFGTGSPVLDDQDWMYRQNERFEEKAVYGELTWHATDTLQFTGGFRHFTDDTVVDVDQTTGLSSFFRERSVSHGEENDSDTLFKGNVSWAFATDQQLYATVSEGYRRGGTNGTPTTGLFGEDKAWTSYQADTVRNYEIGVKGGIGRMTYNADVFYVDWENPQINSATTVWGFFAVQNVESASTRGVELEVSGSTENGFGYGLGYTYTDAHLDADAIAADGAYVINFDGARLPGVPEHRVNGWASYGIPLGKGQLTLRGDAYYQSETDNVLNQKTSKQFYVIDDFSLFNLSATYTVDAWDVSLWLKNATDEAGITGLITDTRDGPSPSQNYFGNGSRASVAQPRTLGLTVSYSF